ncbi:MAG: response regulator [Pseudomonadota bacterium]
MSGDPVAPDGRAAPRLAVVGPDQAFGRLLGTYLVTRGWQVKVLEQPRELLQKLERLAPDLVCLALGGPDPAGLELVALLRCLPSPPPILICTPQLGARAWSRPALDALGVCAVLTRPVPFPALERALADCLPPVARASLVSISSEEATS